jgi:hypothetical protein
MRVCILLVALLCLTACATAPPPPRETFCVQEDLICRVFRDMLAQ